MNPEGAGKRVMKHRPVTMETIEARCIPEGECLLWNQSMNSANHPIISVCGVRWLVRRYVYTVLLGRPIKPTDRITLLCKNPRCVAPGCLVSRSHARILRDAYRELMQDDTERLKRQDNAARNGLAKINREQAVDARAKGLTPKQISDLHGITVHSARLVANGTSWAGRRVATSVFNFGATL